MLRVVPVEGKRALGRFISLPWSIYATDPVWIPPLLLERRLHLSRHNPYFEHAEWSAWLACRGDKPVGRITAQIDTLRSTRHDDVTGAFGLLEAQDDPEIFQALFETAERWLKAKGMRRVQGPFNLSINEECGLLVEGFDTPPMVMMGHARPYYAEAVRAQGYTAVKDLLAYTVDPAFELTPAMRRVVDKALAGESARVAIRSMRRRDIAEELETLRDIFNDAWRDNWGFVPFTAAEFKSVGLMLKAVVDDSFVKIAEVDGEPAGFIVALPNINEAIRDLDGRLLPIGWLKLLWRFKVSYPRTGRVALMGVRKKHQQTLLGSALPLALIHAVKVPLMARGMTEVEMSWILDDNKPMRKIIESLGGVVAKRYRVYEKVLPQ